MNCKHCGQLMKWDDSARWWIHISGSYPCNFPGKSETYATCPQCGHWKVCFCKPLIPPLTSPAGNRAKRREASEEATKSFRIPIDTA